MTKKSKGLIIALIVLLSLIAVLLVAIMSFMITGHFKTIGSLTANLKSSVYFDESYDAADITDILIDSDAGNITIKDSDDGKIRVVANGNNQDLFNAGVKDGRLTVESKARPGVSTVRNHSGADLDIYIPQNIINKLTIESAFGNVDILSTIDGELKVKCDFGNITADCLIGCFDLHSDLGDVEIKRADITSDSSATTNLGDVEIEKTNSVNISARTSLGDCKVNNSNSQSPITLKAESNLGDVEVN